MKIREMLKVRGSLINFAKIRLPNAIDNYNVFKLYKQVENEVFNYNTQKDKIIMEYGEEQSNDTVSISPNNPNYITAIKIIAELENIDVDLEFKPIILKPTDVNLSPIDIYNLTNFKILTINEG